MHNNFLKCEEDGGGEDAGGMVRHTHLFAWHHDMAWEKERALHTRWNWVEAVGHGTILGQTWSMHFIKASAGRGRPKTKLLPSHPQTL